MSNADPWTQGCLNRVAGFLEIPDLKCPGAPQGQLCDLHDLQLVVRSLFRVVQPNPIQLKNRILDLWNSGEAPSDNDTEDDWLSVVSDISAHNPVELDLSLDLSEAVEEFQVGPYFSSNSQGLKPALSQQDQCIQCDLVFKPDGREASHRPRSAPENGPRARVSRQCTGNRPLRLSQPTGCLAQGHYGFPRAQHREILVSGRGSSSKGRTKRVSTCATWSRPSFQSSVSPPYNPLSHAGATC